MTAYPKMGNIFSLIFSILKAFPLPQLYEILPWPEVPGKYFKIYHWYRISLSYSYFKVGIHYQVMEISSISSFSSCVRFFPQEWVSSWSFQWKGKKRHVYDNCCHHQLWLCLLQTTHVSGSDPYENHTQGNTQHTGGWGKEKTPGSSFFVSLQK